ncbi:MAG: MFS transporter, partial [Succinivibrio sp.]
MSGSKLTFRWGIPYALLSFARDGVYVFVMSYYFVYLYQVIGLSGVFLAAMFVVLKVIDIVKEPFLGMLLDYSAAKFKFNKFRTFVVAGGIVNSVITATMFNLHAQPTTAIYALSALLLFVWNLTFSVIDLPAWSVSATLDTNNEKREQISALARAFQVLGFCTILIVSSYMFHQDSSIPSVARQTPVLAFNHGGCWIALMELTITFLFALLFNRPEVQRNVVPLKDTLKAFFGNDQLMITWCITILQQIAFFVFVASHGYFLLSLPYLPTGKEVFVLIQLPWLFVAIISFAMYQPLVKIFSRKKIFIFSLVLAVISETSLLIITYLGFLNFPMLAVMMSLCSIAFALNLTSTTVMT